MTRLRWIEVHSATQLDERGNKMREIRKELPAFYVISAFQSGKDEESNRAAHGQLLEELRARGFDAKEVQGCYKGQKELAMLMLANDAHIHHVIMNLACRYGQESVLFVSQDRNGFLWFTDEKTPVEYLGTWQEIPSPFHLTRDAWTQDLKTGLFYVVE